MRELVNRYLRHFMIIVTKIYYEHIDQSIQHVLYPPSTFKNRYFYYPESMLRQPSRFPRPHRLRYPVNSSTEFIGPDWQPIGYRPINESDYFALETEINAHKGVAPRAYHRQALEEASTILVNPFTRDLLDIGNMTQLVARRRR